MIPSVLPILQPFSFLCHQIWSSETSIPQILHTPILLLSGSMDELIPPSHMKGLCYLSRKARGYNSSLDLMKEVSSPSIPLNSSSTPLDLKSRSQFIVNQQVIQDSFFEKDFQGIRFVSFQFGTHNNTAFQPNYFNTIQNWWNEIL